MDKQTAVLDKIEENTRPILDIYKFLEKKDGGLLKNITDAVTDPATIVPVATGLGALYGIKKFFGKWVAGAAEGAAARGAGRFIPRLGIPLTVAGGVYDAYSGVTAANEAEEKGDITHAEGNIEKWKAVGEGVGGAAGALALGQLGFGLGGMTGPLAPVASPVLGLAFGTAGYFGGEDLGGRWGGWTGKEWNKYVDKMAEEEQYNKDAQYGPPVYNETDPTGMDMKKERQKHRALRRELRSRDKMASPEVPGPVTGQNLYVDTLTVASLNAPASASAAPTIINNQTTNNTSQNQNKPIIVGHGESSLRRMINSNFSPAYS